MLLRAADRRLDLSARVAACFSDGRHAQMVEHALPTLIAQRVHAIALGYEDVNDHDDLRHDAILGLLASKRAPGRKGCAVPAGKSTLNRLELFKIAAVVTISVRRIKIAMAGACPHAHLPSCP